MRTLFLVLLTFSASIAAVAQPKPLALAKVRPVFQATLSLTPQSKNRIDLLKNLSRTQGVLESKDMFSVEEKKIFNKLNLNYLSLTKLLKFNTEKDYLALKKKIKLEKIPLHLDPLDLQTQLTDTKTQTTTDTALNSLQWALHNKGTEQSLDLDSAKAYRIPGRSGEDIHLPLSFPKAKRKIRVAVLDTGIDFTHPDLQGVIARNETECAALESFNVCLKNENKNREACETEFLTDHDGNGYPLDCSGWSILGGITSSGIMGKPDFKDEMGHGTHVAGLIAANRNDDFGIQGVSSNVEIIPIQVLSKNHSTGPVKPSSLDLIKGSVNTSPKEDDHPAPMRNLSDYVARGVLYALNAKADVMNFSLGWPQFRDSDFMKDLIAESIARGVIVVAAAGNDSTEALIRPCAYPGVICVGALNPDGAMAHYSNYGSGVDIAAPGTNILSIFPIDIQPIYFVSRRGFEFMHGTSQASPIVAGTVAEMLAQSIPSSEIRARLIAGARPLQIPFQVVEAPASNEFLRQLIDTPLYSKSNLGGQLDVTKAFSIKAVPVIVPSDKENPVVEWDSMATQLHFPLSLTNIWKDVSFSDIQLKLAFREGDTSSSVRPEVISVNGIPHAGVWQQNQKIQLDVLASIPDRTPYNPELTITVKTREGTSRSFSVFYDIVVPIGPHFSGPQFHSIPIESAPGGWTSWLAIDEKFDSYPLFTDYFIADYSNSPKYSYSILAQDRTNLNGAYKNRGTFTVDGPEDSDTQLYEQIKVRMDNKYILGFQKIYNGSDPSLFKHTMDLFVLSPRAELLKTYHIDSKTNEIPQKIRWMSLNGSKTPAWVGFGTDPEKDPDKKPSLIEDWKATDSDYRPEIKQVRLYYFDAEANIKALQDVGDYKIVDILNPTSEQILKGHIQVLLAKNLGTPLHPSYLYDFARAEIIDGKAKNITPLQKSIYRNVLATSVDQILNLATDAVNTFVGTFWFGPGINRDQRISTLVDNDNQIKDFHVASLRNRIDAALKVRALFGDDHKLSAFVMTNSELQYHDLVSNEIAYRSLERYTYIQDDEFTSFHYPMLITDEKTGEGVPSLYITQSTEFSKALKVIVPVYSTSNKLGELIVPAKLRFKTDKGCVLLENPTRYSLKGVPSLDLLCQQENQQYQLFRIEMAY
jgi:subtilisin family serine protease